MKAMNLFKQSFMLLALAVCVISCGDDDEIKPSGNSSSGKNTANTVTKIATEEIQEYTFNVGSNLGYYGTDYTLTAPNVDQLVFYSDYKYKFSMSLVGSNLDIFPYIMNSDGVVSLSNISSSSNTITWHDYGKKDNFNAGDFEYHYVYDSNWSRSTSSFAIREGTYASYYAIPVYPQHLVAVYHASLDGAYNNYLTWIYFKDVNTGSDGQMKSITIQYAIRPNKL